MPFSAAFGTSVMALLVRILTSVITRMQVERRAHSDCSEVVVANVSMGMLLSWLLRASLAQCEQR